MSSSVPGSCVDNVAAIEEGELVRPSSKPRINRPQDGLCRPRRSFRNASVSFSLWRIQTRSPPPSHRWTRTLGTASFTRSPAPALGAETPGHRGWRYARTACCAARRHRRESGMVAMAIPQHWPPLPNHHHLRVMGLSQRPLGETAPRTGDTR